MTSHDSLRLVSYNCWGWNSGQHTVFDLLQSCDICFVQEHWLLHEQLNLLNIHCDFLSTGVSGMDSSEFHLGRPFSGCAILQRRSFLSHVSRLDTSSKRFCSVLLRDRCGVSILSVFVFISLTMMDLLLHIMISWLLWVSLRVSSIATILITFWLQVTWM